ncbi:MAG: hypothetical protein WAK75_03460 [Methanoregula sp.]|uniref:hypothetical protein n=1 Tax=Methanoregula sp. TaxID=2052170 RepID=UPI003BAFB1CB
MDYPSLMKEARRINKERYKMDLEDCFESLPVNLMAYITTAMSAVQTGITTENFATIAEGQAILEQVIEIIRASEKNIA